MIRKFTTGNIVRYLAIGPNNARAEFDTSIQALEWLEQSTSNNNLEQHGTVNAR